MIRQLAAEQPFIMRLRDVPDNGSTQIRCPACGKDDANWEEYFCRHCGEHHDVLYLKDHLLAPITLSREEIRAEYEEVGLVFAPRVNPIDSGLRFLSYAEMTGIDPWVEMPRDHKKERPDKWSDMQGFHPDRA